MELYDLWLRAGHRNPISWIGRTKTGTNVCPPAAGRSLETETELYDLWLRAGHRNPISWIGRTEAETEPEAEVYDLWLRAGHYRQRQSCMISG